MHPPACRLKYHPVRSVSSSKLTASRCKVSMPGLCNVEMTGKRCRLLDLSKRLMTKMSSRGRVFCRPFISRRRHRWKQQRSNLSACEPPRTPPRDCEAVQTRDAIASSLDDGQQADERNGQRADYLPLPLYLATLAVGFGCLTWSGVTGGLDSFPEMMPPTMANSRFVG